MPLSPRLQVGIDVSKNRLDFALLAPDGTPIEIHQAFPNSLPGYEQAKALLLRVLQEQQFSGLDVAAEATSYYWLPFFVRFSQDEDFRAYDATLYLLNARWVRWYKHSLSPDHKDDFTDPQYIADRIRTRKPAAPWTYAPHWLSLRWLTRLHAHLTKALVREKNLFQLYLFLTHSTYAQRQPFSDPLATTSQELLRHPELLDLLAHLSPPEATEQLDELSGHRLPQPQHTAEALQQVLQESFPVPEELAPTLQFLRTQLLETITQLQEQIRQVDRQIEQQVATGAYPDVTWLDSVPGVGPILSAGLAAEIAGLERFVRVPKWDKQTKAYRPRQVAELEDALGKLAGLWWPKNASGQFEAEERRLSREGNAYLRYYILEAAENMRLFIPSYAAYYRTKYNQATKHKHKRAVVLTGRKALGLFVALLHHQETYRAKEGDVRLP